MLIERLLRCGVAVQHVTQNVQQVGLEAGTLVKGAATSAEPFHVASLRGPIRCLVPSAERARKTVRSNHCPVRQSNFQRVAVAASRDRPHGSDWSRGCAG